MIEKVIGMLCLLAVVDDHEIRDEASSIYRKRDKRKIGSFYVLCPMFLSQGYCRVEWNPLGFFVHLLNMPMEGSLRT